MEPSWVNYHKHTSLSNRYMKDSPVLPIDYWNELKRRYGDRPCIYTTVEHGWAGNYFKQYDDLEKYNKKNGTNIQWVYGCEAYWVKNRHEQDRSNCHIVLLALTDKGRRAINKAVSIANKDGYYYGRPRVDMELLLGLPPDDVMITTACVAFWNKYDDIDDIVMMLSQHFPYFYLEVQPHDTDKQKDINRHIIELSNVYGIPIIAGCDSHYITANQAQDRDELLKSSDIHYEDEDGWYMDYPTYDELVARFKRQGVLSDRQIASAIEATNFLFQYEPIKLDRSLKVPVIKPLRDKTQTERNAIFEQILKDEWKAQRGDIDTDKLSQYQREIHHDIGEIEACNMADYFILSYEVMKRAQEVYGGILTPSGRGSAVSMFINKLLRLTKVDKVNSPVLMYSERFLTKERVLDSHTPPDIDNNVSTREPFIQAQRDLVGDLGTYDLLAMGTLKFKAAWKMYSRAFNVPPESANEVSRQIGRYEEAVKHSEGEIVDMSKYVDEKYRNLVDGCHTYMGIYDTAKGHPCAVIAFDGDVEEEIGISLCKSEATGKEVLVANIESGTIDAFGYLKQDYLVVDSVGLTYDVYKEAGIEPFTVNELLAKIEHDDATWQIYADGHTQCVNQCEQPKSTQKVMRYKPKNISELTQFIAAIRPGFQSMYNIFESRQHFDYGIKTLDDLLQDQYCTSSFMLYQESLMKVLGFAGFPMSETYTIVKAISKKKDYVIKEAKPKFIANFAKAIIDTGDTNDEQQAHELADKVWRIIEDNASYSFNSAHAYCMAVDSVTIAYLKAHYPIEFYKCVLQRFTDKGEKDKVSLIKQEMLKRGFKLKDIKFGDDNRQFNIDHANDCIVQTMASIKDMPKSTPQALYELGQRGVRNRGELYHAIIDDSRINKTATEILFKLGYFEKFGHPNKLIAEFDIYQKYISVKVLTKSNFNDTIIDDIRQCCGKETDKQFRDIDNKALIVSIIKHTTIKPTTITDRIKWQLEFLGYCTICDTNRDVNEWAVTDVKTNSFGASLLSLYNLQHGVERQYKCNKKWWATHQCKSGDIIKVVLDNVPKWTKNSDGKFIKTNETEVQVKCFKVLDE
jgi:DNA polymerase III alpha subunit